MEHAGDSKKPDAAAGPLADAAGALPGVSVVIPCLNEEASIGQVIDAARAGIAAVAAAGEVIVVDNGSTDRSVEIAKRHGARVLTESHRGYGSALRKGFANARHAVVVMGDGDLTYDFTKLGDLVRPILAGEAEFVIGNRMGNILPGAMPALHRYIGNPILSGLLRVMFRDRRVRDVHCGLRAISRDAYRRLRCVTTGMEFASEMVVQGDPHRASPSPSGTSSTTRASATRSSSRSATAGATCASWCCTARRCCCCCPGRSAGCSGCCWRCRWPSDRWSSAGATSTSTS